VSVVDRDYKHVFEDYEDRVATGLCVVCREDEALPDDELCAACLAEIEPHKEPDAV
jgi:hypothetical protein